MTNIPLDPSKSELRKAMRRRLRESTPSSPPVCEALGAWLDQNPGLHFITTFCALPGEVDLSPLVTTRPDHCWLYPRVQGDDLTFHPVKNPDRDLIPGAFGILEPAPELPTVEVGRIDAFLCPGLAFDSHGGRLGRGRGFYDRMLSRARPEALKIGICFPVQKVRRIAMEPHDIRMDLTIS